MKVTVRISDIEVIIERPNMGDYCKDDTADGPQWRESLLKGTVLPMLETATEKAKELYNLKHL